MTVTGTEVTRVTRVDGYTGDLARVHARCGSSATGPALSKPAFWGWVDHYPHAERAKGYLLGWSAAAQVESPAGSASEVD